jgi:hypothetical protein
MDCTLFLLWGVLSIGLLALVLHHILPLHSYLGRLASLDALQQDLEASLIT